MKVILNWLALSVLGLATAQSLWAQAFVDESLETATLYVDAVNGDDGNPGTLTQPFQTIGAGLGQAITNNKNGTGTLVIVNPGTYREALSAAQTSRDTTLPITIEAATTGTVVISGAQLYTGWTPYSGNSAIYTTPWINNWGLCTPNSINGPPAPDIVLRREMVFVNTVPMTQVLSLSQMLYPGTFFADEAGGTLYLWPPVGVNPTTASVDVATQPTVLAVSSRDNIVFRGLTFQYANSCRDVGAVTVAGTASNVLFDSDTFVWNNALGFQISVPTVNFTVQNSNAVHNGESGFQISQTNHGLWQSNFAGYNNWRGAQGNYFAWNSGGFHFFEAHNDTLADDTVAYNQTHGIHWDTDLFNIVATRLHSTGNVLNGLMVEASEGPVTISNSTICNNDIAVHDSYAFQGGLLLRNSTNVTLSNSTLFGNQTAQIDLQGQGGGLSVTNWETGEVYSLVTSNLTLASDVIDSSDGTQNVFSDSYLVDGDWTSFVTTLTSNANTWWNPTDASAFVVPSPNQATQDVFATWQSLTGQDTGSIWAQPADPTTACAVPVDAPDYWLMSSTGTPQVGLDGKATVTATLIPLGGMTGTVKLSADRSAVPGLTVSISPSTLTLDGKNNTTATVTYSAATTTAAGTYQVPVLANLGSTTRTSVVFLTVPVSSVRLSTTSLTFGSQTIGTGSVSQAVTLTNIGSTSLSITSIATGTNFSQTNSCGSSLKAGQTCTITVTFVPVRASLVTGAVTITDGDTTSSPQTVSLSGTGLARPTVTLTPDRLAYGTIGIGASFTQSATLTNSSTGASVLAISSIAVTGTNPSDYSQNNNCGTSLAAGASCTINAIFAPNKAGVLPASLTVTENSNSGTHSVTLTGTGATAAAASYSPAALTFANTTVGSTAINQIITLTNTDSSNTLTINSVTLTGANPGDFTLTNGCGSTVKHGRTCTFTVGFVPTAAGIRTANVTVVDSANPATQTVSVTGTGVEAVPLVSVTPASLNFGTLTIGSTSAGLSVTMTNASIEAALSVTSVTITGANPGDFAQINSCPSSLAAGASCTITATFTPKVASNRNARININDNASPASQTVTLSGKGSTTTPTVTLTPASLTFPATSLGSTSVSQNVTVKNTSTLVPLIITSITLGGANAGDFTLTNTCPVSLAVGANCILTSTFIPTTGSARTATITLTDNTSAKTQTVSLSGTGINATPTVSVTPSSLTFAATAVGTSSAAQTITLKNTSAASSLSVTSILASGTNATEFAVTNNCGSTLAAGASCTATVIFTPAASGIRTATVTLTDNASPTTQTVSLTGTAAVPTVSVTPVTLAFGNVSVGATSASQAVTITNTSAAVSLSVTSLALSGNNVADFHLTNGCGSSLAAGVSCTATITFSPGIAGGRTATLTVTDSASPTTQHVHLTGTGVIEVPTATLTPVTLTFASTTVGTTSASQIATLTNNAKTSALNISSVIISGLNATEFSQTNNCGTSLAAKASCTLTIAFAPSAAGARVATLTVTDNAAVTTQIISLSGTGTAAVPTASLSPANVKFGNVTVGTKTTQTVTLTNTSTNINAVLNITSVKVMTIKPFSQTNNCGASLNAGQSCTITVTFSPTATGAASSTLTVTDNASPAAQKTGLTGTGT